jgi:hypothetical protein
MSTESLEQAPPAEQAPPIDAPPPEQAAAPPADPDAALDAELEQAAIVIPGDEKLVPLSAVTTVRDQLKAARQELGAARTSAERATQLEQQIAQLQAQVQQTTAKAQAYDAAVLAQRPPETTQQPPEDTKELEELARVIDLYTADGKPDIDRARKVQALQQRTAEQVVQQHVAPIRQQSLKQQAATNLLRAKETVAPNGTKADPAALDAIWARLAQQEGGMAILADPQAAGHLWVMAVGTSSVLNTPQTPAQVPAPGAQRGPNGQFVAQPAAQAPPLFTERAGGRDAPTHAPLDDRERRVMAQLGMTEQEYLESAAKMPGGRR